MVRKLLHYTFFLLSRKPLLHSLLPWHKLISDVNLINANSWTASSSLIDQLYDPNTRHIQWLSRMHTKSNTAPPTVEYLRPFHKLFSGPHMYSCIHVTLTSFQCFQITKICSYVVFSIHFICLCRSALELSQHYHLQKNQQRAAGCK
jgi:hypothetical protein